MSADTAALPAAPRPRKAALRRLTLTELTLFTRERGGIIWGIGLPLVLLIIFGNIPGFRKPVSPAAPQVSILDSYVPILLALVLAMIALNVLPPVLAGYREKGVLRRGYLPRRWARSGCSPRSSSSTSGWLLLASVLPTSRGANAAGTILFFPMMFFAGLWLPIAAIPAALRHVSHATPLGAAVQAMTDAWQGHWHPLYLLILAGYAVAFAVAAARLFHWE